eukprot:gb/GECG01008128.1/.p1 GENE.gb/GECG01008128.1/~~gb/GECG01008128.1/.p1  ORF type:complete len:1317 (+),score=244.24 gb/GECG01008128.1/:1-3951(+)
MPPKKGKRSSQTSPTESSARQRDAQEVKFEVELAVRFTQDFSGKHAPEARTTTFRVYSNIFENESLQTPSLEDDASWVHVYEDTGETKEAKGDKKQPASKGKKETKKDDQSIEETDDTEKQKLNTGVRFRSMTSLQTIDQGWIEQFATDPELSVIMDAPVTKEDDDPDEELDQESPRDRYAAVFRMDLSSLLSSKTSYGACFGSCWPDIEVQEDILEYVRQIEQGYTQADSLKTEVTEKQLSRINEAVAMRASREKFIAECKSLERPVSTLPSFVSTLQIKVTVRNEDGSEGVLLSGSLRDKLNPLSVFVRDVKGLPGISVAGDDESVQQYCRPTRLFCIEKHCYPLYVSFEFQHPDLMSPSFHKSFRRTATSPHCVCKKGVYTVPEEKRSAWNDCKYHLNFSTTYLIGLLEQRSACSLLEENEVKLRIHDRDAGEGMIAKGVLKTDAWCIPWENLLSHLPWLDSDDSLRRVMQLLYGDRIGAETYGESVDRWNAYLEEQNTVDSFLQMIKPNDAVTTSARDGKEIYQTDLLVLKELDLRNVLARMLNPHVLIECTLSRLCSRLDERVDILQQRNNKLEETQMNEKQQRETTKEKKRKERLWRQAQQAGISQGSHERVNEEEKQIQEQGTAFESKGYLSGTFLNRIPQEGVSHLVHDHPTGVRRECDQPGGENTAQLAAVEKLLRNTPSCTHAMTTVRVNFNILHPVSVTDFHDRSIKWKFQRMVLCVKYSDYSPLKRIIEEMEKINRSAVDDVKSTYTHELSAEEADKANKGELDIITGFHVADDRWRLIVVEGRGEGAGPRKFKDGIVSPSEKDVANSESTAEAPLDKMRITLRREYPDSPTSKLLDDPTVYFADRLYTPFNLFLKTIRLRGRLADLVQQPTTYKHDNARYESARGGLQKIFELRRVPCLRYAKMLDAFPLAIQLTSIEELYGDSVSLEDLRGPDSAEELARKEEIWKERRRLGIETTVAVPKGINLETGRPQDSEEELEPLEDSRKRAKTKRKGSVKMSNEEYEKLKKQHEDELRNRDYIRQNIDWTDLKSKSNTERLKEEGKSYQQRRAIPQEVQDLVNSSAHLHIYSGQKLSSAEMHRRILQQRAAKDQDMVHTYDTQRLSATISPYDMEDIQRAEEEEDLQKRRTTKGFTWVTEKDMKKRYEHPQALTDARRADLKAPYQDEEETKAIELAQERTIEAGYPWHPVPNKSLNTEFGYVDEHGKQDPNFFKTVHIGGEGIEAERKAAQEAELKEWMDKLVVDDVVFKTHYQSGKSNQIDKYKNILASEPKKRTLRQTYRTKRPDGTRGGPEAAPVSIFLSEE